MKRASSTSKSKWNKSSHSHHRSRSPLTLTNKKTKTVNYCEVDARKILHFLRLQQEPQKTLAIAKACDHVTTKAINPTIYELERQGLLKRRGNQPPTWSLISQRANTPEVFASRPYDTQSHTEVGHRQSHTVAVNDTRSQREVAHPQSGTDVASSRCCAGEDSTRRKEPVVGEGSQSPHGDKLTPWSHSTRKSLKVRPTSKTNKTSKMESAKSSNSDLFRESVNDKDAPGAYSSGSHSSRLRKESKISHQRQRQTTYNIGRKNLDGGDIDMLLEHNKDVKDPSLIPSSHTGQELARSHKPGDENEKTPNAGHGCRSNGLDLNSERALSGPIKDASAMSYHDDTASSSSDYESEDDLASRIDDLVFSSGRAYNNDFSTFIDDSDLYTIGHSYGYIKEESFSSDGEDNEADAYPASMPFGRDNSCSSRSAGDKPSYSSGKPESPKCLMALNPEFKFSPGIHQAEYKDSLNAHHSVVAQIHTLTPWMTSDSKKKAPLLSLPPAQPNSNLFISSRTSGFLETSSSSTSSTLTAPAPAVSRSSQCQQIPARSEVKAHLKESPPFHSPKDVRSLGGATSSCLSSTVAPPSFLSSLSTLSQTASNGESSSQRNQKKPALLSTPLLNRKLNEETSTLPKVPLLPVPQASTSQQTQPNLQINSESFAALNKNPISALMEYAQSRRLSARIELISQSGPPHKPVFVIAAFLGNRRFAGVTCHNKKDGRKDAAEQAIRMLIAEGQYNITQDASVMNIPDSEMTHFDKMAALTHAKFNQLIASIPESFTGRKVIAGLVMKMGPDDIGSVISIGSGNRCITGDQLSLEGNTVNDCHAEIITRRGFLRFLYEQLLTFDPRRDHSMFEMAKSGKVRVKDSVTFHLYISTAPCGDGALFSPRDAASNNGPVPETETEHCPTFTTNVQGVLRTKMEGGEGTIPVDPDHTMQTWDGIVRGERLRTMSCSDKICRWNVLGLQGALLSHFFEPIYLRSLSLGFLYDHGHLSRAVCCRLNQGNPPLDSKLPDGFRLNHPLLGRVTACDPPRETQKTKSYSINWSVCQDRPELLDGSLGICHTGVESQMFSRLSKRSMFDRFKRVCQHFGQDNQDHTYVQTKRLNAGFAHAKQAMKEQFVSARLGKWVSKPIEEEMFN